MGGVAVLHPQDYLADNPFPAKPRRNPRSEPRKRRNKTTVTDPPVTKTLVMGQVKILKRGEPLDESSSPVLKDINDRNVTKDVSVKDVSVKTSSEKKKDKRNSNGKSKIQNMKHDDFALCSTNRLGPDPEMVPKEKLADFFFAGSAFVDSPPPSSLPLPGFFAKKEDPTTDLCRILGLSFS